MLSLKLLAALLLSLATLTAGITITNAQTPTGRTVTIVADGEARAEPDIAIVGAGVEADGATPREALDAVNRQMAGALAVLRGAGIAPEDIQTSGLSLFTLTGPPPDPKTDLPRTIGYRASNTVAVTIRDITRVEAVVDLLVNAGITNLNGLRFAVADQAALHARALANAVENARPLAEAAARAAGLTLGPVTTITETTGGAPVIEAAAGRGGGGGFVAPGSLTFTVRVQVTYQVGG